jgi:hypothetical protein
MLHVLVLPVAFVQCFSNELSTGTGSLQGMRPVSRIRAKVRAITAILTRSSATLRSLHHFVKNNESQRAERAGETRVSTPEALKNASLKPL